MIVTTNFTDSFSANYIRQPGLCSLLVFFMYLVSLIFLLFSLVYFAVVLCLSHLLIHVRGVFVRPKRKNKIKNNLNFCVLEIVHKTFVNYELTRTNERHYTLAVTATLQRRNEPWNQTPPPQ